MLNKIGRIKGKMLELDELLIFLNQECCVLTNEVKSSENERGQQFGVWVVVEFKPKSLLV